MARKKQLSFSREEVEFAAQSVAFGVLQNVLTSLLNSGAAPDPQIGALVMHFANGVNTMGKDLELETKKLVESTSNSVAMEKFEVLQEIVGEQVK